MENPQQTLETEKSSRRDRRKEDQAVELSKRLTDELRKQRHFSMARLGIFAAIGLFVFLKSSGIIGKDALAIPRGEAYVSMVRITGEIKPGSVASAEKLEGQLTRAFYDESASGVLLVVNSPGGTAVQGLLLNQLIDDLKQRTGKKVVVFGEDVIASGAYMAALAADSIYITESTVAGSIGVIQNHFNVSKMLDTVGVITNEIYSGEFKNRFSMFTEPKQADLEKAQQTTEHIHQGFIEMVKSSRNGKLQGSEDTLFSGDFWVGDQAHKLGLVDGIASMREVLTTSFAVSHVKDYTERPAVRNLSQVLNAASAISSSLFNHIAGGYDAPQAILR